MNFSAEAALAFKFSSLRLRLKLLEKTESGNCGLSIQTKGKERIENALCFLQRLGVGDEEADRDEDEGEGARDNERQLKFDRLT